MATLTTDSGTSQDEVNDGDDIDVDDDGVDGDAEEHLLDLAVVLLKVEFEICCRLSRLNCLPLVHLHCLHHDHNEGFGYH